MALPPLSKLGTVGAGRGQALQTSGELFGAGGLNATPDHPRGTRSMSRELRCKGQGEWNV